MDRIDIHLRVNRLSSSEILRTGAGTSSQVLRDGVLVARDFRSWREATRPTPEGLGPTERLMTACRLNESDVRFFEQAVVASRLSGRAIMRILALARTIADLDQSESVCQAHLCEAMALRLRDGWEGYGQ